MKPQTLERIAQLERLVDDDVPLTEALERMSWTPSGCYQALYKAEVSGRMRDVAKEAQRLARAGGHGTRAFYASGCRCQSCRDAHAAYRRKERANLAPCGTEAAYRRHYARGEEACAPCKAAHSEHTTAGKRRRRAEALAADEARAESECAVDRLIRQRIAALAPVKSWAARERAAELRLLLTQITQNQQKDVA